jgi:uncharacterized protein (UPF0303 family)
MSLDADIACLIRQEDALRFTAINEQTAWDLGTLMRSLAVERKLPLVIDIRVGDRLLFHTALPGTTIDNYDWVRRKVRTVMRFEKCSYRVGREHEKKNIVFAVARGINPLKYALAGGGFPIHVKGTGVVGCVTVSGVPQRDDHNFVAECLSRHLGVDYATVALGPETSGV